MHAPPGRYIGSTAILSRFSGLLLDPAFAHVTSFSEALVLGPESGWPNWQGGFVAWDFEERLA